MNKVNVDEQLDNFSERSIDFRMKIRNNLIGNVDTIPEKLPTTTPGLLSLPKLSRGNGGSGRSVYNMSRVRSMKNIMSPKNMMIGKQ